MVARIKTHIEGFDKIVKGGIPTGSAVLIAGMPGTGKTIFCLQALYNNAKKGKKAMYISLQTDGKKLKRQMDSFGWKIDKKIEKNFKAIFLEYKGGQTVHKLFDEIEDFDPDLIAIDSLASIFMRPEMKEEEFKLSFDEISEKVLPIVFDPADKLRTMVHNLIRNLEKLKTTSLLISEVGPETNALSRDGVSEYESDAIVKLSYMGIVGGGTRTIEVIKLRASSFLEGVHSLYFDKKGVSVSIGGEEKL